MSILRDAMPGTEFTLDESTGFLTARGVLARTGIQNYRAVEIGLDGDPMRIVRVYRPHSEVFDKQSMASFENRPLTIEHPSELVTADNWRQHAVGEVRDVQRDGNNLVGTVIVKDSEAIKLVQDGLRELSNGYLNMLEFTPGTTPNGESYDAVQRQIRGNHVALVKRARCGSECRLTGDGKTEGEIMEELQKELETVKAALVDAETKIAAKDAEIKTLTDSVAEGENKVKELSVKVSVDSEKVASMLADAQKEIARLTDPETIAAAVKEWAQMTADAAVIVSGFVPEGVKTAIDFQRAVLRKAVDGNESHRAMVLAVTGGKTVCDADNVQIQSAFRLLASVPVKSADADVGKYILGATVDSGKLVGAAAFAQRMMNGFLEDK